MPAVGFREFLSAAGAHRLGKAAAKIAKEGKRPPRSPFLAHEQHRHIRREQGDGERGFQGFCFCILRQAVAKRAIADLIVVLHEVDEGERRQRAARLAARLAATKF